ncbi:hypothetical protein V8E54_013914 [Elaphomyces granulatus]
MALLLDRRGDQIQITKDVVKAVASNDGNGKEAIPQVKEKQNHHKTDDGDGLAIVASLSSPAQSSYIGLPALAATCICKEFCFLSTLRFQTSLLLLVTV